MPGQPNDAALPEVNACAWEPLAVYADEGGGGANVGLRAVHRRTGFAVDLLHLPVPPQVVPHTTPPPRRQTATPSTAPDPVCSTVPTAGRAAS